MATPPQQLELFAAPPPLTREEAIERLLARLGEDLRPLSDQYGLTQPGVTPLNKGWAGLTVERLLGLAPNNEQAPDFGDWELKVLPLKMRARAKGSAQAGMLSIKGPLALTKCQLSTLLDTPFEESHVWHKTRRLLLAARLYHDSAERSSPLYGLAPFDLYKSPLKQEFKAEYEALQWALRTQGVMALKGEQGRLLALQDQGEYKGWSFYAQRPLLAEALQGLITSASP